MGVPPGKSRVNQLALRLEGWLGGVSRSGLSPCPGSSNPPNAMR